MSHTDELRATYDRIAPDFHRDHLNDRWSNLRVAAFATYFEPGARVLDVGCGTGIKSKVLADAGLSVHGTDLSPGMIEEARRQYPDIRFDAMDIREITALPDVYDGILAFAVLLHLPKAEAPAIVRALANKLVPGGKLMVAVKSLVSGRPEETVVTEDDYGYAYSRFFSYYAPEEMRTMLISAGLTICSDELFPPGEKPWHILVAYKP